MSPAISPKEIETIVEEKAALTDALQMIANGSCKNPVTFAKQVFKVIERKFS